MEFDKNRVYTALNADELKPGDKVVVADNLTSLKNGVAREPNIASIMRIRGEDCEERFCVGESNATGDIAFSLAYLVERAENCTNCIHYEEVCLDCLKGKDHRCCKYEFKKIEPKTEKKCDTCKYINCGFKEIMGDKDCDQYEPIKKVQPFKDTDELIKVWGEKAKATPPVLDMPYIWVRRKEGNSKGQLITEFSNSLWVEMGKEGYNMTDLFEHFTFLDGSPCGVEE